MMKKYITSGIAAAILASAAFVGTASAQSMYDTNANSPRNVDDGRQVDTMSTGSIYNNDWRMQNGNASTDIDGSQDRGDYYDGAVRPQD